MRNDHKLQKCSINCDLHYIHREKVMGLKKKMKIMRKYSDTVKKGFTVVLSWASPSPGRKAAVAWKS